MSSINKYQMMIFTLIVVLTFGGVITGQHILLEKTGLLSSPENFETSGLWIAMIAALAIGGLGSLVIGYFTKTTGKDSLIALWLSGTVAYFVFEFTNIIFYIRGVYTGDSTWGWIPNLITIIFGMLIIGYISSIIDFYQGGS